MQECLQVSRSTRSAYRAIGRQSDSLQKDFHGICQGMSSYRPTISKVGI
ncbi:hypothetical protein JMJ77_0012192 [Colletotrichum scovillei]|uniref:Uncharacterized protein n=1 Tax=Colletotrichum scovillei TaxID=1209932 RepID=A0A9P7QV76_9PEZI|nr:hypothetical protein JMJ78_0001279 [Colletotrichum scovillei]KAG7041673.1 hypothetical protein JMJ77_0012192 [Colletotrichum scovillei]KAG7061701.1 hypothetical protein JMJ76_0003660 [Colletotrichum scovillei]